MFALPIELFESNLSEHPATHTHTQSERGEDERRLFPFQVLEARAQAAVPETPKRPYTK